MTALNTLPAHQIVQMIRTGETTPSAVMAAHLERIAAREMVVGAFQHLDAELAMKRARAADGECIGGALHGVPFVVKDIIDTDDMPTCWGSNLYAERQPGQNAACVQVLLGGRRHTNRQDRNHGICLFPPWQNR